MPNTLLKSYELLVIDRSRQCSKLCSACKFPRHPWQS